jgi:hypothetical protein
MYLSFLNNGEEFTKKNTVGSWMVRPGTVFLWVLSFIYLIQYWNQEHQAEQQLKECQHKSRRYRTTEVVNYLSDRPHIYINFFKQSRFFGIELN